MLDKVKGVKREADLVMLDEGSAQGPIAAVAFAGRISWSTGSMRPKEATISFASEHETMVILFDTPGKIAGDGQAADAPLRSLSVVPPGSYEVQLAGKGCGCILSTDRKRAANCR